MRLILIGPPGSGKGTQAKLLCQRLGLEHIGTGDMLRDAIRLATPAGRKAQPFVAAGQLVPDDLVNQIIADFFSRDDRPEKFVMDGYPRTLPQAMSFEQVLRQQFLGLDAVVVLQVDDEEIVQRMSGRWICSNSTCGTPYHTSFNPPRVAGNCDVCGSALMQRDDDKEQTVRKRLKVFHATYGDLLDHYKNQGLLREVVGHGDIETIYNNIIKALKPV
ncbi:MAG TPA: adenylate kinase [Gemmataceae bacterium]|nr:adenylate kinase [Gemmataceae bacterium]